MASILCAALHKTCCGFVHIEIMEVCNGACACDTSCEGDGFLGNMHGRLEEEANFSEDDEIVSDTEPPNPVNCSQQLGADEVVQNKEQTWLATFSSLVNGVVSGARLPASVSNRRQFPVPVSFRLAVQLVVGSFCCMALAMQATEPVWLLMRILLALVSIAGFTRLFGRCRTPLFYRQTQIPVLCIANYIKIALVAVAASVAATAATLAATTAMIVTAATVYWRAAWDYGVGRERRRWYANLGSFVLDLLELGALLLQMILMTQVSSQFVTCA